MTKLFSVQLQFQSFGQNGEFDGTLAIMVQADASGAIAKAQAVRNTATGQPQASAIVDVDAADLADLIQAAKDTAALLPPLPAPPAPVGL